MRSGEDLNPTAPRARVHCVARAPQDHLLRRMAPVPGALKSPLSPPALRAVASIDHADYPQF